VKATAIATAASLLSLAAPACAHRLDEYLQATLITLERDRVQALVRLIPGVAVSSAVLAAIDTNADGVVSETERRAYAERVLGDLSLREDGHPLTPKLVSVHFPDIAELRQGTGEIQIEFSADLPRSNNASRTLTFENHHQSPISVYLANCLVPRDKDIRIVAQRRNPSQSFYKIDYSQEPIHFNWWPGAGVSLAAVCLLGLYYRKRPLLRMPRLQR
jgi:hypothetical protein